MSEGGDLLRDDYYSMTYGNQITPMPLFYNLVLSVFFNVCYVTETTEYAVFNKD